MLNNTKRLTLHALLWFSLVYFLLGCGKSAIYTLATNEYSVYAFDFLTRFFTSVLFLLGCVLYLARRDQSKAPRAFLGILPIISARVFYILPYDYFYYLYDGYDSMDALLIGLIQTAIEFALLSLLTLGLCELARRLLGAKRIYDAGGAFDFSNKSALALFLPVFAVFLYHIVTELYSTILYLITYAGTYRMEEIAYMVGSFVILLGFLFLWQWLTVLSLKVLMKTKFYLHEVTE